MRSMQGQHGPAGKAGLGTSAPAAPGAGWPPPGRLACSFSQLRVLEKVGKWMPSSTMLPSRGAVTPRYRDTHPSLRTIFLRLQAGGNGERMEGWVWPPGRAAAARRSPRVEPAGRERGTALERQHMLLMQLCG